MFFVYPIDYALRALLLVALIVGILGLVGLYNVVRPVWPVLVPRLLGNIPVRQTVLFSEQGDQYPVLVETPREVRPGSTFELTIRGAEYRDFSTEAVISYTLSTDDIKFVRQIEPAAVFATTTPGSWMLSPTKITISTVNLDAPPAEFGLKVAESVLRDSGAAAESAGTVLVEVDRAPVPTIDVARAFISLLAFLVGTFGTFLASKLFG